MWIQSGCSHPIGEQYVTWGLQETAVLSSCDRDTGTGPLSHSGLGSEGWPHFIVKVAGPLEAAALAGELRLRAACLGLSICDAYNTVTGSSPWSSSWAFSWLSYLET